MNNFAIARVFTRIADLMEIQGENVFKIKAYRTAAQAMQELTESLEVLAERDELKSVPGIGDAIAAKTQDILTTGTTKLYEHLRKEVPESLVELLNLPAFGPKKIHTVWKELGILNLDDLEQAARDHRLQTVPGFAAKTEAAVLAAIEAYRRRREHRPNFEALPYAQGLARMLMDTGRFERVEIAGSIRRMKDMVGDIDLAAAASDIDAAVEAVATHPEIQEVLARSSTEISACTHNGYKVDVRVVQPEYFGLCLQHFTGSPAHNQEIEEFAQARGIRHSEEYAPTPESDGPADAPFYDRLGLPWIPPELREGKGEVRAAAENRLPRLIEISDYRGALHAHSTWTDGASTIARMAQAARDLGYSYHANTDHSKALAMTRGLDEERLVEQMAEIDALNATFEDGFRILKGIECDILADGSLDLAVEMLDRLDVVVCSVHGHRRMDEDTMTRRIIRALESGVVDILGHPTGRILGARDPYPVDMERVMDAALANQVALEINAYADRQDMNDVLAHRAKERGVLISINPDAHRTEHLSAMKYGLAQARRAWLEPEEVINTWPLDRLMAWLENRRG